MKAKTVIFIAVLVPFVAFSGDFPIGTMILKSESTPLSFTFKSDNTYVVARNEQLMVEGVWEVIVDTLIINDKTGDKSCPAPGKYLWGYKEKELTFKLLSDECTGRANAMTSGAWMLKE